MPACDIQDLFHPVNKTFERSGTTGAGPRTSPSLFHDPARVQGLDFWETPAVLLKIVVGALGLGSKQSLVSRQGMMRVYFMPSIEA
ncbi:MAG: hypothetical protein ACQEUH_10940, partial [Pseudomonadota bacterium]